MRSINFPTAFSFSLAQGTTTWIGLGPLSPKYHLVRGVFIYWRLRNAFTAGDFMRFRLRAGNVKATSAAILDGQREIILGTTADVDSALRSCFLPINHVPRDGKEVYLTLEVTDQTGATGTNGIVAFDVVNADWSGPDKPALKSFSGATGAAGDGVPTV